MIAKFYGIYNFFFRQQLISFLFFLLCCILLSLSLFQENKTEPFWNHSFQSILASFNYTCSSSIVVRSGEWEKLRNDRYISMKSERERERLKELRVLTELNLNMGKNDFGNAKLYSPFVSFFLSMCECLGYSCFLFFHWLIEIRGRID